MLRQLLLRVMPLRLPLQVMLPRLRIKLLMLPRPKD
jgi:hypothetical protein